MSFSLISFPITLSRAVAAGAIGRQQITMMEVNPGGSAFVPLDKSTSKMKSSGILRSKKYKLPKKNQNI
jgi:hypothetical protein